MKEWARRIQCGGITMSDATESAWRGIAMIQSFMLTVALVAVIAATPLPTFSQSNPDVQTFFRQDIGLSQDQITAIRNGQPVTKTLPSRTPAEVFLFGSV